MVRETPEDIVARLNRSFKMNPANVERIVGRRSTRRGGGHGVAVEYEVVWQGGRFEGPRMEDGFIQGGGLSVAELMLLLVVATLLV